MIKGITSVAAIASDEGFDRLSSLFRALGFADGKGWSDGSSRGAAFLAPVGNLELVTGRAPATPGLLVEVTQLDAVYAAVQGWITAENNSAAKLTEVAPTHWNSRLFTVDLA